MKISDTLIDGLLKSIFSKVRPRPFPQGDGAMFEDFLAYVRQIDWTGYQVSVFEVLLVVFALIKKFNFVSLLILGIVLGKGFYVVQQNTQFTGSLIDTTPFMVYTVCAAIFFIYAVLKLFHTD
jgi:hypothetical protein